MKKYRLWSATENTILIENTVVFIWKSGTSLTKAKLIFQCTIQYFCPVSIQNTFVQSTYGKHNMTLLLRIQQNKKELRIVINKSEYKLNSILMFLFDNSVRYSQVFSSPSFPSSFGEILDIEWNLFLLIPLINSMLSMLIRLPVV